MLGVVGTGEGGGVLKEMRCNLNTSVVTGICCWIKTIPDRKLKVVEICTRAVPNCYSNHMSFGLFQMHL